MSFRLKTILGIALIEAVLLAILIWTSLDYLRNSNEDELRKRAHTAARLFATTTQNAVLATDLASLESAVTEMLNNPGIVYARVRGRGGVVLAEGGEGELLRRPFQADEAVDGDGDGVLDVFEDIAIAGAHYGRVEIGLATGSLQEVLAAARRQAGLIAAMEMGLVALFSFALGTYLTHGLARLRRASRHIAAGELAFRLEEMAGGDELADTVRAFNQMSRQLEAVAEERERAEAELSRYRDQLESLVASRTEELSRANASLRETNSQLAAAHSQLLEAERMASLGQLAAGVAHEINNPIGFVTANLRCLEDYLAKLLAVVDACGRHEASLPSADRQEIQAARQAADLEFLRGDLATLLVESKAGLHRVAKIVRDLRDFSCIDTAQWRLADLHAGLDTTLDMVSGQLGEARVVRAYGKLPEVECLPSELNRVFLNLLTNAAQAISGQGTITIRTSGDATGVSIEIADTGCGIAPENLSRVFDPFFTTRDVGQGTGLGLSLAYGIVQRHHGRLNVASAPGQGTTFRLWLPTRQPLAPPAGSA